MTAELKLLLYLALAAAFASAGGAVAWEWQANSYEKKLEHQKAKYDEDNATAANAIASQLRQAIEKQQAAEQVAANLDAKGLKEKADALAKNELLRKQYDSSQADNVRLSRDVVAGYNRLRIAGSCSASAVGSNLPKTTESPSLGNASTFELSSAAGQTVFDIRAGILSDQAALAAAQQYIKEVCQ